MRLVLFPLLALLVAGCSHAPAFPDQPMPTGQEAEREARPSAAGPTGDADWRLSRPGGIEGYADQVSVLPGERFGLRVSTSARRFVATAFRMGAKATLVWRSDPVAAKLQPPARLMDGMVSAAHWSPSLTVDTTGWPEGAYLIRLECAKGQSYVPITVRSAATGGRVVLINAVTTWQAYNRWGGRSLYSGPGGFTGRSASVTFDRPYERSGARLFLDFERDAVALAEESGVPVAYLTDLDLVPGSLDGASAVISLGHDEYWTREMRAVLTGARDQGSHLAFLGANAVYWRITARGRVIECDKTVRCRLWRASEPESSLVGQMYDCFPAEAAYVVRRPEHWIFDGTRGTRFPGLVGVESDRVAKGSPGNVRILAESPVRCGGRSTVAHSTFYVADSGAMVFATGTMRWVCGMRGAACGHGVTAAAAPFTRRVTLNLLRRFAGAG